MSHYLYRATLDPATKEIAFEERRIILERGGGIWVYDWTDVIRESEMEAEGFARSKPGAVAVQRKALAKSIEERETEIIRLGDEIDALREDVRALENWKGNK